MIIQWWELLQISDPAATAAIIAAVEELLMDSVFQYEPGMARIMTGGHDNDDDKNDYDYTFDYPLYYDNDDNYDENECTYADNDETWLQ